LDFIKIFLFIKNLSRTLQTPKSTVEIKELNVDISKDGGSKSSLLVKLQILPILVHIGEPRVNCEQLSNLSGGGCNSTCHASIAAIERSSAPFFCEKFLVSCEYGHDRYISSFHVNLAIIGIFLLSIHFLLPINSC
jgi:hypothetical protein